MPKITVLPHPEICPKGLEFEGKVGDRDVASQK